MSDMAGYEVHRYVDLNQMRLSRSRECDVTLPGVFSDTVRRTSY